MISIRKRKTLIWQRKHVSFHWRGNGLPYLAGFAFNDPRSRNRKTRNGKRALNGKSGVSLAYENKARKTGRIFNEATGKMPKAKGTNHV